MPLIPLPGIADARGGDGKVAPMGTGDGALFNEALTSALEGTTAPEGSPPPDPASPAATALQRVLATLAARVAGTPKTGHVTEATPGPDRARERVLSSGTPSGVVSAVARHTAEAQAPATGADAGAIASLVESILSGETDGPFADASLRDVDGASVMPSPADGDDAGSPVATDRGPTLASVLGTEPDLVAAFVAATPGTHGIGETVRAGSPEPTFSSGAGSAIPMRDALVPEFRSRLERVIDRMQTEFGYTVEVVETVRSQARQDQLFQQGRVAPGPVVTWTRSSRHTDGLAADLMVDGTWNNPVAYDRLARIAREEGLRTLGARDRGHIELPRTALARGSATALEDSGMALVDDAHTVRRKDGILTDLPRSTRQAEPATTPRADGIAQVARVAEVARVATVASVARVAGPGASHAASPPATPASFTTVASSDATTAPVEDVSARSGSAIPVLERIPRNDPGERTLRDVVHATEKSPGAVGDAARAIPRPTVHLAASVERSQPRPRAAEAAPAATTLEAGVTAATGEDRQAAPASRLFAGVAPESRRSNDTRQDGAPSDRRERRERDVRPVASRPAERIEATLLRAFDGESREPGLTSRVERTEPTLSATALDRINQIAGMRDAAAERPLSSVLLRLDRPDGGEDRIRVDLRGSAVGASFEMSDAGMAEDLGRHLADLARSLERQGLDAEAVTVRALAGKESPLGLSQAVAGERDALRTAATSTAGGGQAAGREGRGAPSRQDHPQDEPPRQRPRRDSRGDR